MRAALWGAERFADFRDRLGISDSVLASRLRDLVDFHVLALDDGRYRLTESGRDLWRVLAAIWSWERRWVDGQDRRLPEMWHRQCRHAIGLDLRCDACGRLATLDDIVLTELEPEAFARSLPPGTRRRRRSSSREDPADDPLGLGSYESTMTLIGSRWSAAHLGALLLGARRFAEVERLTGAGPAVVSERISEFVEVGAITVHDGRYEFTEAGAAFLVVVAPFVAWALTHHPDPGGPPISATHRTCGRPFVPLLCCSHCGTAVEADDLRTRPGAG